MRLINTTTFALEYFPRNHGQEYAILSHRWEDEEVTFEDMQSPSIAQFKKGFAKIEMCCNQAVQEGLHYAWIDTCCIDKSNSQELSEAINSMYAWYQNAEVCYAYLSDVSKSRPQSFAKSAWFTRGWTLQELLAPSEVIFYDNKWRLLGSKDSEELEWAIVAATHIDREALRGKDVYSFSIAQRMSWAARRETTFPEDRAYSLMGLFGVHMPMIYGEGEKAFSRLQDEIIKHSDDHSIFMWKMPRSDWCTGLMAPSPDCFEYRFVPDLVPLGGRTSKFKPFSLTNQGLSIELSLTPWNAETYLALFHSRVGPGRDTLDRTQLYGFFLRRVNNAGQYTRICLADATDFQIFEWYKNTGGVIEPSKFCSLRRTRPLQRLRVNIRQNPLQHNHFFVGIPVYGYRIIDSKLLKRDSRGNDLFQIDCKGAWDYASRIAQLSPGQYGTVATIRVGRQRRSVSVIRLGFDFDFNPVCAMADARHVKKLRSAGGPATLGGDSDSERLVRKGIEKISCMESSGYTRVEKGCRRWTKVYPCEAKAGLWAFKGDRESGLRVRLVQNVEKDGACQVVRIADVIVEQYWTGTSHIWDVRFYIPRAPQSV